jgi:hypothetical protein
MVIKTESVLYLKRCTEQNDENYTLEILEQIMI